MPILNDFEGAQRRARARLAIDQALRELPAHERRTVLLDACVGRVVPSTETRTRRAPRRTARGTRTAALLERLAARPGEAIAQLARRVYGASTPQSRDRLRALLQTLKRQGRVRHSGSRGQWLVVRH